MSEAGSQFRNAAFGGFNRQDVLEYIERAAKENNAQLDALRQENETIRNRNQELERELDQLKEAHAALTEARETADNAEAASLRQQVEELREENRRLQPEVDALRELKAKLADIEVEARVRGESIVQKANAEAEDTMEKALAEADSVVQKAKSDAAAIRVTADRALGQAQRTFEATRTDLEATASHLAGELERIRSTLLRMGTAMDEYGAAVSGLKMPEEP